MSIFADHLPVFFWVVFLKLYDILALANLE